MLLHALHNGLLTAAALVPELARLVESPGAEHVPSESLLAGLIGVVLGAAGIWWAGRRVREEPEPQRSDVPDHPEKNEPDLEPEAEGSPDETSLHEPDAPA
jgi:hypothetical protein